VLGDHAGLVGEPVFVLDRPEREQHSLLREAEAGGEQRVQQRLVRSSPKQPTSPVEAISTPSIGSAPARRENENIGAFTPT
jgi:hypothetical protein